MVYRIQRTELEIKALALKEEYHDETIASGFLKRKVEPFRLKVGHFLKKADYKQIYNFDLYEIKVVSHWGGRDYCSTKTKEFKFWYNQRDLLLEEVVVNAFSLGKLSGTTETYSVYHLFLVSDCDSNLVKKLKRCRWNLLSHLTDSRQGYVKKIKENSPNLKFDEILIGIANKTNGKAK